MPQMRDGAGKGVQTARTILAGGVVDLVRRLAGMHGDRALLRRKTPPHMQRRPWRGQLVFGEAEAELGRRAMGGAVTLTRCAPGDIHEDKADRPADGGIGPPALTHAIIA